MREIKSKKIQVPHDDLLIDAYLAQPTAEGNFPAIIVIQEIFGVNEHICDVTNRIAREGYIAIAPAIYQRLAPGFSVGYTPQDIVIGKEYKNQTKAEELLGDIQATIDYLHQLTTVKKIGCIGFCFGGHVVYLAATLKDIQATASFYGAGITNWIPGGGEPTIDKTKNITGTLYGFFGMKDVSIPEEQVDEIEAQLEQYAIPHRVFRYLEADHGFFCDARASYNQSAAKDAWKHVLELFSQHLF